MLDPSGLFRDEAALCHLYREMTLKINGARQEEEAMPIARLRIARIAIDLSRIKGLSLAENQALLGIAFEQIQESKL